MNVQKFDMFDVLYAVGIVCLIAGAWGKWGPSVAGLVVGGVLVITALVGSGIIRLEGRVKRGNTHISGK